jgi:hypothetical protein
MTPFTQIFMLVKTSILISSQHGKIGNLEEHLKVFGPELYINGDRSQFAGNFGQHSVSHDTWLERQHMDFIQI